MDTAFQNDPLFRSCFVPDFRSYAPDGVEKDDSTLWGRILSQSELSDQPSVSVKAPQNTETFQTAAQEHSSLEQRQATAVSPFPHQTVSTMVVAAPYNQTVTLPVSSTDSSSAQPAGNYQKNAVAKRSTQKKPTLQKKAVAEGKVAKGKKAMAIKQRKVSKAKRATIYDFLLKKLCDGNDDSVIWQNRSEGTFVLAKRRQVIQQWGKVGRSKGSMTFESMARGMRYHYKTKVMRCTGQSGVYAFNPDHPKVQRYLGSINNEAASSSSQQPAPD
ncbi:hypothetical protein GZ77_16120 [Endozoicomonas montiporae]|uniref:ETS domain-containing protein n=2 Tax=Endozoicomonas montiporae TaxID=1027273 RepID=A0A081N5T0_9GAMM|nr:ETS domain-containing protein [Endozoicomonas montiporae]AMO57296.1 ETS-related transcription factor Elf-3-like [Endozoicomonas montiporae CL-33]KEQ13803.1 hypothetical protein GZ77_16120 [Endozoicomonas montiporae]